MYSSLSFLFIYLTFFVTVSHSTPVTALSPDTRPVPGSIYDVNQQTWITPLQLQARLEQAQYLLLGERHDNYHHHRIQARLIADIAENFPDSSVAFEMIDREQAQALGNMNDYTAEDLIRQLQSSSAAWDYENQYRQLITLALDRQLRLYPANIERSTLLAFMRNETLELDVSLQNWLRDIPLPKTLDANLRQEIVAAHCGMIDPDAAAPMVNVQRLRDITMALSLISSDAGKRFLIAGAGHVRNDRGVPFYLRRMVPDANMIALALMETEPGILSLAEYQKRWEENRFPFDFIWFTERMDRPDPCESFKLPAE